MDNSLLSCTYTRLVKVVAENRWETGAGSRPDKAAVYKDMGRGEEDWQGVVAGPRPARGGAEARLGLRGKEGNQ